MAERKVSRRRLKKYAIGDLRSRVRIHTRSLEAPLYDSADPVEAFDTGAKVWASVNTLDFLSSGKQLFDEVNLSEQPSHKFVIRFRKNISTENVIQWEGNYYKLLKIIDPEERHQFLELFAVLLGDKDLAANE